MLKIEETVAVTLAAHPKHMIQRYNSHR